MAFAQIEDYFIERLHLLTRNEIVVYCYLRKKRNSESGQCNPKQITIANDTRLQTSRVSEAIKGLEAKGWVVCDEFGEFVLPSKVTESVTTQVTNSVRKSYGKRKKKLRNAEDDVTQSVTEINGIEKTIEKTKENTSEEEAEAVAAPARDPQAYEVEILPPEIPAGESEQVFDSNPFVALFQRYFDHELKKAQKDIIVERVRDGTIWKKAVIYWAGNDHKPSSIGRLCNYYDELVAENGDTEDNAVIQSNNRKSYQQQRDERAYDDYNAVEQARANSERRRLAKLHGGDAAGR